MPDLADGYRAKLLPTGEQKTAEHFRRRIQAAKDFCTKVWDKSLENHRFVGGGKHQWDSGVWRAREETGRPTYTINNTALGANALSGMEITRRFERVMVGSDRTAGDAGLAQALTAADRKNRDHVHAENYESDKFRDLGIEGYSCIEWYQDFLEDFRGRTKVRGVDTWHVIWDHAARDFNLIDREWDAAGRWLSIDEFLALYPKERDQVEVEIFKENGWVSPGEEEIHRWPWLYRAAGKYVDPARRDVFLVDYQWREKEGIYIHSSVEEVAGPDGAMRQIRRLRGYNEEEWDALLTSLPTKPPESDYIRPEDGAARWIYKRAKLLGDHVFGEQVIPVGSFTRLWMTGFPFKEMEAVTFNGLIDYMKDPQKFLNAVASLTVSILERSMKGGAVVDPAGFDPQDFENLATRFAQPFPIIPTKRGVMMGGQKFMDLLDVAPYPSGLDQFMDRADQALWRPTGLNPNMLGQLQDPRRVSGRVWSSLAEAGQVVMSYLFNSLRLYRKMSGRLQLAHFREFYEPEHLREMAGEELGIFIPEKLDPEEWGRVFERDVTVDESAATTKDERERLWDFISRQGPMELVSGGVISRKMLVKNMPGISEIDRNEELRRLELMEGIQQLEAQLQQLQQQAAAAGGGAPPQAG